MQIERLTKAHVEPAWQPELLSNANRQHTAVHEHGRPGLCRGHVEDARDAVVVERHVVHRREHADAAQRQLRQRMARAVGCIGSGRIEHEKADESRRMPPDGRRHRCLISRHAGDEHRP